MSADLAVIRSLLETRLAAINPAIFTIKQNKTAAPLANQPWQKVSILFARPDNPVRGPQFYREQGILQVDLRYPFDQGPGPAEARAKLVRDQFPYGLALTDVPSGTTVTINATPEVFSEGPETNTHKLIIRVSWHANMQG